MLIILRNYIFPEELDIVLTLLFLLTLADEEFYYTASDRSIHKFNAATKTNVIFQNSSFLVGYQKCLTKDL